jgi:hypothetical protein
MLEDYDNFVYFIKINLTKFQVYDQDALKLFYSDRMESFNPEYNYKPYWGHNDNIKILHFHGPKPTFSEEQLKTFPYPQLVTPYFKEMSIKFNKILEKL